MGRSFLVLGLVRHIAVDEAVLDERGRPAAERIDPLSRLGGSLYGTLGEILHLKRIPLEEWEAGQH